MPFPKGIPSSHVLARVENCRSCIVDGCPKHENRRNWMTMIKIAGFIFSPQITNLPAAGRDYTD
jgi:hypothetical protein